jgi:hypothetical protein
MKITIICPDQDVENVRDISKAYVKSHVTMNRPLSKSGKLPQTHWLCVCEMSETTYADLKKNSKYSQVLTGNPKLILEELDLKRIGDE